MAGKVFHPGRRGVATVLGPLEAEVMDVVWSSGGPVTVNDVIAGLDRRRRSLAYSTIKTILTNLSAKGYLIKRVVGKANEFRATMNKAQFEVEVVGGVLDSLMRDYRSPLLAHLADELVADADAIGELEHLLAERRRQPRANA